MCLLGILGLLQVWFLPGFFLLSFAKKIKTVDAIILSLPLSILFNYLIVLALVLTKNYDQKIVLLIIAFELFFIIFNYKKNIDFQSTIQSLENFLKFKNLIRINLNLLDFLVLLPFSLILFLGLITIGEVINIAGFSGDNYLNHYEYISHIIPNGHLNDSIYV